MRTNRKTIAAGVGAAGLLGLGLYIAVPAAAADPSPSPSKSGTKTYQGDGPQGQKWRDGKGHPGKRHPHRHVRPFRGVHGEATVRRKDGFHLATWQRGKITALSATTLTVRSDDGASWTWTANANTRVSKNGEKSALTSLAAGDQVLVAGERSGDTRNARIVRVPKPR
ncbi:hypothetical protein E1287_14155 [Actinomadura sp. KC06]|uniref:DUF5666 domain-containing protein n=1 Tax=Actinomadura sp. KC06 TaxID=2530369 RepID=UPI00104556F0|nr:DUF5666 domain-containing protein [Actinomadura sp. KC06]TDD35251.1 hypothetical protein E1287_14155 [Actinomadura sp. KC06]